jgi:hypothetical protein
MSYFRRTEACLEPFGFVPYLFPDPFTATDTGVEMRPPPQRIRNRSVPTQKPCGPVASVVFARADLASL